MEKKVRPTSEYVLKKCCKRENYLDELISKLPDEILVSIVSRLTIKEAARTSILSHRWKNLWTFTTGSLNFDASKTMWEIQLMRFKEVEKVYEKERSRYISWVNQVLTQHQASNIDEFRVSFDLNKDFKCDIDRWINIAMTKRVQRLEIDLTSFVWNWYEASKHYTFPQELYVHMKNPQDLSCTRSLTSLCLKYVNVSEELLEYFLFNCPLERLSLAYSEDLVNLKVAGSSLQLTFLDIFRCASLKNVVICAPNLLSFNYFGPKIRLHIENAPLLVDVSFGGGDFDPVLYAFCPLSTYLSQLETLKLQMVPEEIMQFPQFLKFANLRHLTLRVTAKEHESLLGLTSLLNAAPQLHRFTLQLHFLRSQIQIRARNYTKRPLPCLKVVELVGFVGRRIDVELAMYLFEYAVMLEKIVIDPRNLYFLGRPWENEETKERKAGRKRAQQLAAVVPRGAKLVIL